MMGTRQPQAAAFTLLELIISMAASVCILGALLLSSLSLQKALHHSEVYAGAYSDQRRLTDYLGRDLRRAVALAYTDAAGNRFTVESQPVEIPILERATLIATLPAYYRSNQRNAAGYESALEVVGNEERLDYGNAAGIAPAVEVSFRKIFFGKENCVCFVRQEAGTDEVIVRQADNLFVQVSTAQGAQASGIKTWYRGPQEATRLVSTYDRLLLRNPPLTYRP